MKNLAESQQKGHHSSSASGGGGLAEELVIMGTPTSSLSAVAAAAAAASLSSSSSSGSSWDLRDESRVDGPWKLKTDLLSDAFFEAVLQGLTSSFHVSTVLFHCYGPRAKALTGGLGSIGQ